MKRPSANTFVHLLLLAGIAFSFALNLFVLYYRLQQLIINPDYPGALKTEDYPQWLLPVGLLTSLVLLLLSALWNYRINDLLERMGGNLQYGPGDTVKAWLIPFVNLVRPFFVVRESWNEMHMAVEYNPARINDKIVGFWWLMRMLGTLIIFVFFLFYKPGQYDNTNYLSVMLLGIDSVLQTISLPLFGWIVFRMMRLNAKLAARGYE